MGFIDIKVGSVSDFAPRDPDAHPIVLLVRDLIFDAARTQLRQVAIAGGRVWGLRDQWTERPPLPPGTHDQVIRRLCVIIGVPAPIQGHYGWGGATYLHEPTSEVFSFSILVENVDGLRALVDVAESRHALQDRIDSEERPVLAQSLAAWSYPPTGKGIHGA